jgi:hypothetical protein
MNSYKQSTLRALGASSATMTDLGAITIGNLAEGEYFWPFNTVLPSAFFDPLLSSTI